MLKEKKMMAVQTLIMTNVIFHLQTFFRFEIYNSFKPHDMEYTSQKRNSSEKRCVRYYTVLGNFLHNLFHGYFWNRMPGRLTNIPIDNKKTQLMFKINISNTEGYNYNKGNI